jgi:hypothetical protein
MVYVLYALQVKLLLAARIFVLLALLDALLVPQLVVHKSALLVPTSMGIQTVSVPLALLDKLQLDKLLHA